MTQTSTRSVGNSFRLGYRFQSYWDASTARAFFFAEFGAGTFLVSLYFNYLIGMIVGLALTGILKTYFQASHTGVPAKAWRAILRPDRSWISRGTIGIALMVGCGALYAASLATGFAPQIAVILKYVAAAAALVVLSYQGMAMADSESFTLWASPLVPLASICYGLTAGALLTLAGAWEALGGQFTTLARLSEILLAVDFLIVIGLVMQARGKSQGGAFSADLLLRGELSGAFRLLVIAIGFIAPLALMLLGAGYRPLVALAGLTFLTGFYTFRSLMLRAAVFEPITHDLAGSIGLARR